jgi:hypothetical protein
MGRKAHGKGTGKGGPGRKRSDVHIEDFSGLRRAGDETTFYRPKEASWAEVARKRARHNWPVRKIAKSLDVSVEDVKRVLSA